MIKHLCSGLFLFSLFFSGCGWSNNNSIQTPNKTHNFNAKTVDFSQPTNPVIILGGGIAGLTAALYCTQASLDTVVIEGTKPGGALSQSHSVRNWPGITDKPGAIIVDDIKKQVSELGVSIIQEEVVGVNLKTWPYTITTKNLQTGSTHLHKGLSLIIAMGTEPNYLNIPGEADYWGRGVSNCAVCDGSLYKNKEVALVGGGDAAFTQASYLADIAKKVTLLVRKDHFRAKDIHTKKRVLDHPNIQVRFNTSVKEIKGSGSKIETLTLKNNQDDKEDNMKVDGLFLAIGSRPNTMLFDKALDMDAQGFLLLKNHQETSQPGVFAAGDVCDKEFVQAVTAAGQGCMAALQANKFLESIGFDSKTFAENKKKNQHSYEQSTELKFAGTLKEINTVKEFNELIRNAPLPLVLDLYSTYCMPCKAMVPIIEKIARDQIGKISCYKINVNNGALMNEVMSLGVGPIDSVPLLLLIDQGKVKGSSLGKKSEQELLPLIKRVFNLS